MKQSLLLLCLLCVDAYANPLDYPSVWECDTYKPNWYCDEVKTQPVPFVTKQGVGKPDPRKRIELKDLKTAEQIRQELKRREDVAVVNPTDQNIKDYLVLWKMIQDKGSVFADRWRRVVWQNPSLDYAQKRPVNNSAIKIYDEGRIQKEQQQLKLLAKEHGLIFFFRSDCSYCHAMARTLKMLSEQYGIEVLGVFIDGAGLPDFPNPKDGRTQAAIWGVERVPALFIGAKQTGEHAPIGFGMMALSEIINRLFVLTGTQPGEKF